MNAVVWCVHRSPSEHGGASTLGSAVTVFARDPYCNRRDCGDVQAIRLVVQVGVGFELGGLGVRSTGVINDDRSAEVVYPGGNMKPITFSRAMMNRRRMFRGQRGLRMGSAKIDSEKNWFSVFN